MVLPPERGAVDDVEYVVVHGYRRAYRLRGSGPPLLLLHGMACDSSTWFPVMDQLAQHFTVIAPDLLGHGESDKPNADYSLGGFANGMRDLLTILGIDKVTVAGHSFGGGVAMQFAYQFPERTERVVLVSSGGLGPEVTPLIRALTLPGAGLGIRLATARPWRSAVRGSMRALSHVPVARDLDEVARIYEGLADPTTSLAIRRLTRTVLDWNGQFVTMADRAYLTRLMPLLVVWGRNDHVIPVAHAQRLPLMENSHVHVFEDSGHFPHKDHPDEFAQLVVDFCRIQAPAQYHRGKWRALLRRGDQAGLASVSLPAEESPSAVS
ncbi:alpha/beta fold hydrolase [Aeromicrobium duanguangcaii]|uniref:Alpha/beta fold hydrolase n=1 Tax=Aeromicrobium duanguangcaii TaxID=2968086 RepID=A0ABY5KJ62_9ACTN|nr:alpha/beta fold hydrolase [Aeromicrobium duanguangcaii]MCD9153387.1 alpha/beta fold hydrolase [Aeromicrobium duanguangcaii]UUI69521.1 alpha/beta fold hydrolase [Aeromicrobium duanguangcaii]